MEVNGHSVGTNKHVNSCLVSSESSVIGDLSVMDLLRDPFRRPSITFRRSRKKNGEPSNDQITDLPSKTQPLVNDGHYDKEYGVQTKVQQSANFPRVTTRTNKERTPLPLSMACLVTHGPMELTTLWKPKLPSDDVQHCYSRFAENAMRNTLGIRLNSPSSTQTTTVPCGKRVLVLPTSFVPPTTILYPRSPLWIPKTPTRPTTGRVSRQSSRLPCKIPVEPPERPTLTITDLTQTTQKFLEKAQTAYMKKSTSRTSSHKRLIPQRTISPLVRNSLQTVDQNVEHWMDGLISIRQSSARLFTPKTREKAGGCSRKCLVGTKKTTIDSHQLNTALEISRDSEAATDNNNKNNFNSTDNNTALNDADVILNTLSVGDLPLTTDLQVSTDFVSISSPSMAVKAVGEENSSLQVSIQLSDSKRTPES